MQPVPTFKILILLSAVAIAASDALAFNCCRAADVTEDGRVNGEDLEAIDACMWQPSPRKDLNGNGIVDPGDRLWVEVFVDRYGDLDCSTYCRADLDGDGFVGDADLLIVLENPLGQVCSALRECLPGEEDCARRLCVAADLNKNGLVDVDDQWFLRAEWGACPGSLRLASAQGDAPNPCAEDPDAPQGLRTQDSRR